MRIVTFLSVAAVMGIVITVAAAVGSGLGSGSGSGSGLASGDGKCNYLLDIHMSIVDAWCIVVNFDVKL